MADNNGIIINDFVGGSYQSDLISLSSRLSDNLYSEIVETNDENYTKKILRPIEGSVSAVNFGISGVGGRGLYYSSTGPGPDFQPQLYGAYNNKVYRINSDMTKVELGSLGNNSITAKFTESGGVNSHLCVCDGYNIFVAPLSASDSDIALTTITMPKLPDTDVNAQPTFLAYLGGRVIMNAANSDYFFYTDLGAINGSVNMVSAFNGDLNYQKAENISDNINALIAVNGILWVFGIRSYQIYQSQPADKFNPFIGISTAGNQIGCKAPKSVTTVNNQVFWLGSSNAGENTIFVGAGINDIQRISTNAIEREIGKYKDATDAIGQTWAFNGHTFYSITFPTADKTFVYDLATKEWHNRSTRDPLINVAHAWNYQFATLAYGKIYFSTYDGQYLTYLDDDKFTEYDGRPIVRTRISPVIISQFSNVIMNEFELECAIGTTKILQGQGSNPQVMLQVSHDGGYTWSNEKWKSLGKTGQYSNRAKWAGLGMGRLMVIKVTISDPVKIIITAAKSKYTLCNAF